jgi:hypothetical protein
VAERTATVSVKTALDQRAVPDRRAAKLNPTKITRAIAWAMVKLSRLIGSLREAEGRGPRESRILPDPAGPFEREPIGSHVPGGVASGGRITATRPERPPTRSSSGSDSGSSLSDCPIR